MAKYYHGVRVLEEATALATPIEGTAGLQVVLGSAPVNMAEDPYAVSNVPVLCRSFAECQKQLGYSGDFARYTLCQSMDLSFRVFAVSPIIMINVLDPTKHRKANAEKTYTPAARRITLEEDGILMDTVAVTSESGEAYEAEKDYIMAFDDGGKLCITFITEAAGNVKVASSSIDPAAVTADDIVGGYDAATGKEAGAEAIRQVYPKFGMPPGMLLAPGWSHDPTVGAALAAKCESINGVFRCECLLDLDTTKARKYTDCKGLKEECAYLDPHSIVLWPMVQLAGKKYCYSAAYGALAAYTDASNDDVPNLSPDNRLLKMSGAVLADGTEVVLDQEQANTINSYGIVTALNDGGWKAWGNNTACYPLNRDPKDRWICCRRFFSWWANSFILTYKGKVSNPANRRLIESICDAENIRGNSYVSQGKCAGARMEFREEDNPTTGLVDGQLRFRQHLAPYAPAEDIVNTLSFDPDMLSDALGGA